MVGLGGDGYAEPDSPMSPEDRRLAEQLADSQSPFGPHDSKARVEAAGLPGFVTDMAGTVATGEPASAPAPSPPPGQPARGCSATIAAVGAATVVAILIAFVLANGGKDDESATTQTSAVASSTTSTTAAPTTAPPTTSAAADGPCTQWDVAGTWNTAQGNDYHPTFVLEQAGTTLTGSATLPGEEAGRAGISGPTGQVQGSIEGDQLLVRVTWPPGADGAVIVGTYTATVTDAGLANGAAGRDSWTGSGPARCVS